MTLPNLFIIGAAKAGTTSLHYYLDQHPEVQMSANKEPNFFSGPEEGLPYPMGRISDLDSYEALFDPSCRVRGEASVSYANSPRRKGVPRRIKHCVPEAKFIYLVRDPIDRVVSHYQHRVAWMGERRSIRDALGDLKDPYNVCLCPGFYARQLELYLDQFSDDRLMVIDRGALLTQRREILRDIFDFLCVDVGFISDEFEAEYLKSEERRIYSPWYTRTVQPLTAKGPMRLIPRSARRSLRRSVERILWPALEDAMLDDDLRMSLKELYADDVSRLRELTGMPFPNWRI